MTRNRRLDELVRQAGLWPARVIWAVAPAVVASGVQDLVAGAGDTSALVVEGALWVGWFAVLIATLAPSPLSLTICRIVGPLLTAAGLITALTTSGGIGPWTAAAWGLVFTAVVFQAGFGDRMINGSAYGSERRMALRPQGFVLVGPVQVAWLTILVAVVVPIWAILTDRIIAAIAAVAIGAVAGWAAGRILHQLARRWVVFVPAGFVIKDPMGLVDAVLFRRHLVGSVGPALAEESSGTAEARTDLSGGARGLSIEVALREPTMITVREGGNAKTVETANVVFTPSLPGAMLQEARIRGLKIGTAETLS
jgi:hypothetical protein